MKTLLIGVGALLLTAASASADFQKEWIFKCHYTDHDSKGGSQTCNVLANVCDFTLDDKPIGQFSQPVPGQPVPTPPSSACLDYMIVNCSGEPEFRGEAIHKETEVHTPNGTLHFEVIAGKPSGESERPPMFRYSSQQPAKDDPFFITSWLKVDHDELHGYCEVHHPRASGLE